MRQITVRQLVRQGSKAKLEEWIPCEITADGVVIAVLLRANDVRQAKVSNTMSDKPRLTTWQLLERASKVSMGRM